MRMQTSGVFRDNSQCLKFFSTSASVLEMCGMYTYIFFSYLYKKREELFYADAERKYSNRLFQSVTYFSGKRNGIDPRFDLSFTFYVTLYMSLHIYVQYVHLLLCCLENYLVMSL